MPSTSPRHFRIADLIEMGVLALQLLLVARFIVDLVGLRDQPAAFLLERLTDPLVVPWHSLVPVIAVGRFVLDAGSAMSLACLPILGWLAATVVDAYRLHKRDKALGVLSEV